jgi:hypothetical protein
LDSAYPFPEPPYHVRTRTQSRQLILRNRVSIIYTP